MKVLKAKMLRLRPKSEIDVEFLHAEPPDVKRLIIPTFHMLEPEEALASWSQVYPWFKYIFDDPDFTEEILITYLQSGATRLVTVEFEAEIVGCLMIYMVQLPKRHGIFVYALGGKNIRRWQWGMDQFLMDFARETKATYIEFQSTRKATKLLASYGYKPKATTYRKEL